MKQLLKSTALCIAFVCMVGIYTVTFFYGSLIPKKPEPPKYKINMSVAP